MEIEVLYRTWFNGKPPKPIRLEIPGWAGDSRGHDNGDRPQPWHCQPFVDGSTYGLEIIYPFKAECHVHRIDGELVFEGDFSNEGAPPNFPKVPFSAFAPGHFGCTSALDIKPPPGYCLRIEPHPRFYTDETGTVPIAVAGHIQEWWSRIFFIAFKSPPEGGTHIFRSGEPMAQVILVPYKVKYDIKEMSKEEADKRNRREDILSKCGHSQVAKHPWKDYKGHQFDDKYKVLSSAFAKSGEAGIDKVLEAAYSKHYEKPATVPSCSMKRRLIRRSCEKTENKKEGQ